MHEDEVWLGRFRDSAIAVRHWEQRLEDPDDVAPGSSIDKDDAGLVGHPVRSAAWYGLITAVGHLAMVADLTKGGLTLRPSSFFTFTRAALLGASQAVWLLSGSREERRYRALSVRSDERKQHRGFVNDFARDVYVRDNEAPELVAGLDGLAQELTDEIQSLRIMRKGNPYDGDFVSTKMMSEAAAHLAGRGTMDDRLRLAFAYEWRMASAAAHARSWPMHVRPTEREDLPGGGEVRRMTVSLEEAGQSYVGAVLMTNEAWRLWDLRRRRHN
jgi:hypothetical protein